MYHGLAGYSYSLPCESVYTSVSFSHLFVEMPDDNFKPRLSDQRVGFYSAKITDLSSYDRYPSRDVINKWRLEKKFPDQEISEPVKLTKKAFDLLDHDHANIQKITNKDLINLNLDKFNFYELNTFDFQSLFQFSKIKSSLIATVAFLIIVYGAGLININSNYAQIKDMNKTLTSIYGSIYPNEQITNIEKQIENKLIALNNADKTTLKRSIEIISMASQSADIIEANYSNKLLTIKCLFTNDAEESIFINQQNRLNYSISIKDTESNQLGQITTIEYDL